MYHVAPFAADDDLRGQVGVVIDQRPLGIAGHIVGAGVLGGCLQRLPCGIRRNIPVGIAHCQHFHNSVIALFSVAVDAISLVWLHHVGIAAVKIRDGLHRRPAQRAALLLRVIFQHAGIAACINDKEVVVPPGGRKHIIAVQQVNGLLRSGGAVQHQTDSQRREDLLLAGALVDRLAVQRQHRDGNTLFIHAVQTDERSGQAGELFRHGYVRLVGRDIIQRGQRHGFVAVLRRTINQHGRGVALEIIVAAHQDIPIGHRRKGAASIVRGFHVDRQQGKRFL